MPEFISHPLIKENSIQSRLYQEVLVARVLEKGNTLIVAPTALGKTIIAIMASAFVLEKKRQKKVLFLAPTKPLAVQHEKSFRKFLKLPEKEITLLTGAVAPKERAKAWENSSIIAATPQTIENDLMAGRVSLQDVGLIIFDEAHRAVKDYGYVFIAQQYIKKALSPHILALTASPGSEEEKIQDVCKNLFIQNVEIKTSESADVKPYSQEIEFQWIRVELPQVFQEIKQLLEIFMKEQLLFMKKLGYARTINSKYFGKKQLLELQAIIRRDIGLKAKEHPQVYVAASRIAALLKISHAHTLLETQGIFSLEDYFHRMKEASGKNTSKALKFLLNDDGIQEALLLSGKLKQQGINHPKLLKLKEILEKQFLENPESRVLVFNHYRDSIKYLEKYLKGFTSIRATRFVGQADKGNEKGMTQKEQIKLLEEFREGKFNCLLCSSVAEEGLDIPSVDLVVLYEAVPSEIRSIQRRGRTGRFGKGKVIGLLAKGTRDEIFYYSSVAKERRMQETLHGMQNSSSLPKQSTLVKYIEKAKEQVLVYVDTREQSSSVSKTLSEMGALIKVKQLEVGDFVLSDDVVVERKTVEDFLQSMVDGRLFTQLMKMSENYASPLVLVEGSRSDLFSLRDIHRNAIIGALSSIALNYKVPVLFTEDENETAEFLMVIARREQLAAEKDIRLRVGRKGLTLAEQQRFIAESLPLVGPTLAKSLLKHFGSIKGIVDADEKQLQEIEKLGPKKAKQIMKVLGEKYKEE